jgi:heme exporter protein D
MTSLYGVIRGQPPKFFDGNDHAFTGLQFHLETESFAFFQPLKMLGGWPWQVWTALGAFVAAAVGYAVVSVVWQILRDRRARRQRV